MPSVYLIADTHFGHKGVCHFLRPDGTKLRPWDNADDMDKEMVTRWNATVKPTDKVYVLGDAVINRKALVTFSLLHGDKVLIKGNHDIFKPKDYAGIFRDIRAYHVMAGYLLSHIPVHPHSLERWNGNIHGHTHAGVVLDSYGKPDVRYLCVSAEHQNFTPLLFERVVDKFRRQQGVY